MDTKSLVKIGAVVVVVGVVIWQGMGLFGGGSSTPEAPPPMKPNPDIPKPAALLPPAPQQPAMSEREVQLLKMQQEFQARYQAQLAELQMLKLEKDIAETNKDIQKAKLDTLSSQKDIIDLLVPAKPAAPSPESYSKNLSENQAAPKTTGLAQTPEAPTASQFTVVSISRIRGEWTAVIGYSGVLFSVKAGQPLAEGMVVYSIDGTGVTLESKDGKKTKIALVSII